MSERRQRDPDENSAGKDGSRASGKTVERTFDHGTPVVAACGRSIVQAGLRAAVNPLSSLAP
jgi:hypothetical protein